MKTLSATLVLFTFFSFNAIAQETTSKKTEPCTLEVKYDRFKDETTDTCGYLFRSSLASKDELSIHLDAQYSGKQPSSTIRFSFWLHRFYLPAPASYEFFFRDATELFLIIDDKRFSLPITNYKAKQPEGEYIRVLTEDAEANIDAKTLAALSIAHSVEARWGYKELSMSSTAIERMQQFIGRYKGSPK